MSLGDAVLGALTVQAIGKSKQSIAQLQAMVAKLQQEIGETRGSYASVAAGYIAFRVALEKADPGHPLVVDEDLRQRLGQAGERAVALGGLLSSAKEAGRTFAVPAREGGEPLSIPQYEALVRELNQRLEDELLAKLELQAQLDALQSEAKKIEVDLIDHVAQRAALRKELGRLNPENPLVTNADLRQRISEAGQRAFAIDGSWSAVNEAGASFLLPTAKGVGGRLPDPDPTFVAGLTDEELAGRSGEDGV